MAKKRMALWKTELLIFGLAFLLMCIIFALLLLFPGRTNTPRFIGFIKYLRLFLNDDIFLKALWNTIKIPIVVFIVLTVVIITVKRILSDKVKLIPQAAWDAAAYCILFFGIPAVSAQLFAQFYGIPSAYYGAHIITAHLSDIRVIAFESLIRNYIFCLPLSLLLTFIVWCAEHIISAVVSRSGKGAVIHG